MSGNKINWQQPFVNTFKYFAIESEKNVSKAGDVTTLMVNTKTQPNPKKHFKNIFLNRTIK